MIICSQHAAQAIDPYSQAMIAGNSLFICRCYPFSPADSPVHRLNTEQQTNQTMYNFRSMAEAGGAERIDVDKTSCFIRDLNHFWSCNAVYRRFFSARSCAEVARLPEAEAIAVAK